jgi:hypothetical protein
VTNGRRGGTHLPTHRAWGMCWTCMSHVSLGLQLTCNAASLALRWGMRLTCQLRDRPCAAGPAASGRAGLAEGKSLRAVTDVMNPKLQARIIGTTVTHTPSSMPDPRVSIPLTPVAP